MLRMLAKSLIMFLLSLLAASRADAIEPIKTIETGKNAELRVNGKPFFR